MKSLSCNNRMMTPMVSGNCIWYPFDVPISQPGKQPRPKLALVDAALSFGEWPSVHC